MCPMPKPEKIEDIHILLLRYLYETEYRCIRVHAIFFGVCGTASIDRKHDAHMTQVLSVHKFVSTKFVKYSLFQTSLYRYF
jgi:hypothetical protein